MRRRDSFSLGSSGKAGGLAGGGGGGGFFATPNRDASSAMLLLGGAGYEDDEGEGGEAGGGTRGARRQSMLVTPSRGARGAAAATPSAAAAAAGGDAPMPGSSTSAWHAAALGALASGGGSDAVGGGAADAGPPTPAAASFVSSAAAMRLAERVRELTAREAELNARVAALAEELLAARSATDGDDGGNSDTPRGAARLLRTCTEELASMAGAYRSLQGRVDALTDRLAYYEAELRRAAADIGRLRGSLKEERRKGEKLFASLAVEREANAAAQAVISDLKDRLGELSSAAAYLPPHLEPGGGPAAPFSRADARGLSFAQPPPMATPSLQRGQSMRGMTANFTPAPPPSSQLRATSSDYRDAGSR